MERSSLMKRNISFEETQLIRVIVVHSVSFVTEIKPGNKFAFE